MRLCNQQIIDFLKSRHPTCFTASEIVKHTGLSFSAVRSNLNMMRERGLADRSLDGGLNGHTIYQWYWTGGEPSEPEWNNPDDDNSERLIAWYG